jgi:leucyl aminopeptidase
MIGVSPKQVKQTAGGEIRPPDRLFRLQQGPRTVTAAALRSLDHLLVLTPAAPGRRELDQLGRKLPLLRPLTAVAARLGKDGADRIIRGRLAGAATGISWARLPAPGDNASKGASRGAHALPESFPLLRLAGELAGDGLADQPRTVGVLVHGLEGPDEAAALRALVLALGARSWQGPGFRKTPAPAGPATVRLLGLKSPLDLGRTMVEIRTANLVRWLASLPANKLTVSAYRELAEDLARRRGWDCRFLDEKALHKAGAGAFLAVAQGNAARDAGILHLRYRPRPGKTGRTPAVALVGKGILFDTGGNNLKPAKAMLDMHMDMAGSAVALAVLEALTLLKVPVAVDCWLALTENRIGPAAVRQRDVVRACDGTTIEIIHTDAEGRLALADTLALAGREKPGLVLDFATLTGACVYALSERYSGVFTNRDTLNPLLTTVGRESGERVWPFPMDPDFDEDLKSTVADVAQCTMGGEGDHILAARFLNRFVPKDSTWVHMDLSAVMRKEGLAHMPGGATGFGLRYTLSLLLDHAAALQAVTGDLGLPTP